MKLKVHVTKKNLILTAIVAFLSVSAHFLSGISVFNMVVFIALYFFVKNLELEVKEKYHWLWTAAAVFAGSILTTWLVQYLLLVEDLRDRISDRTFLLNIFCCFVVYLMVQICTNRAGWTIIIAHTLILIFAGVNYFVYEFRGNELTFGDFKSLSTGLSVASNYQFSLNAQAMNAILLTIVFLTGAAKLKKVQTKHVIWMRLVCVSLAMFSIAYVADKTEYTVTETWEQKGTYQNGYLLNFVLSIRDSFVEEPKMYSKDAVQKLEKEYADSNAAPKEEKPTILVIMNESFADFSVLGNLQTNQPVTPFLDSLNENITKGYALSSVYGAKTPNSEWEFLTGNTMAFLPSGSVPYQQYVNDDNAYSIVDILKKEDYNCVSMHPYYSTGWSRDTVYPKFGFDEMYFLEDFDQTKLMRKYITDAEMYDKMIDRYEAGKGKENLFIMGITMQNHGGYKDLYDNFRNDTFGTNIRYADVNQYLSLLHQSDLALKDLIEYFSKEKEPVVICFFGDHQPSLNTAFYRRLNGKGISGLSINELEEFYQVPYFIWSNDTYEGENIDRTSLNYLSTMLLERAGISLPPYHQFLSDLMKEVPEMNARAYFSKSSGRYVHYGKGSAQEELWIEKYKILQYNGLFDTKNQSDVFFGE